MWKSLLREGLGESAAFYRCHPLLNLVYFAAVIGVTMFAMHPAFLAVSFAAAWVYSLLLKGQKALKFNIFIFLPTAFLMTLINTLTVHNGVTVLFYLNGNRITLEAIIYGFAAAVMLTAVIIWFSCFSVVMTSDKFIYLFGRAAPTLALLLSMVLRYIPLLQKRFKDVSAAQRCMGRGSGGSKWFPRIRQFGREVSVLIAWSLESSIESADSMTARGYGLRGRTSFHLFRLTGREKPLLALLLVLGAVCAVVCGMGKMNIYYYPKIILPPLSILQAGTLAAYLVLLLLPAVLDVKEASTWN